MTNRTFTGALALALSVALLPTAASACALQPPQLTLSEVQSRSAAIVSGTLVYRYDSDGKMHGVITVTQVTKGLPQPAFGILHTLDFDPACQPYGWFLPFSLKPKQVTGRFYLFRGEGGGYEIARFAQTKGR